MERLFKTLFRRRYGVILPLFANLLFFGLVAQENAPDAARQILQEKLDRYSCRLTEREAEEAAAHLLRLDGITVQSFAKTAECMKILVKGLRAVVEKHQGRDAVYRSLQMQKYNIQPGNWDYYLKKYQTPESISKLEKWIPDNEKVIVKSTAKSVKPLLERWLLEQKILKEFFRRHPDKKDLPDAQKIQLWWEQELKTTRISDDKDRQVIIGILARKSFIPRRQEEFWKQFFAARLKDRRIRKIQVVLCRKESHGRNE